MLQYRTALAAVFAIAGMALVLGTVGCSQQQGNPDDIQAQTGPPSISLVSPEQGEVIEGSVIMIQVRCENFVMAPESIGMAREPGRGHWHLYLDGDLIAVRATETFRLQGVAPGPHHLKVSLANNDHTPLYPPVEDVAIIEVREAAPTEEVSGTDGASSSAAGAVRLAGLVFPLGVAGE